MSLIYLRVEERDWLEVVGVLWTEMLKAVDGVAKSDGSDVEGTWLQLMCCPLPKHLCP